MFICLPLLGFCLGWSSNFASSEYGQMQNMVSNRTQHPHPLPTTHCLYILYFDTGKSEGGAEERRLEGQQFTKLGRKYQHDWLYLRPINSDKIQLNFFRWRHFAWPSMSFIFLRSVLMNISKAFSALFLIKICNMCCWAGNSAIHSPYLKLYGREALHLQY